VTRLLRIWSISALMPAMLLCANPGIADDSRARDDSIDFDEVVRAAAAIPFEMPRGELLVEIGFARSAAGDQAAAQSLFVQGIKLVEHAADSVKEGHRKALINVHLALLQHRIGDQAAAQASFTRALEVAKAIGDKNLKVDALQFLARTQAETGDFAAALHTTRFFSSSGLHLKCLVEIAKGQARAGDLTGALTTAAKIRALGYREKTRKEPTTEVVAYHELVLADVLGEIAMGQAKSGESGLASARKTIHDALGLVDRSLVYRRDVGAPALANIALVQAKLGDRVESQKSFERALRAANERTGVSSAEIMANIALARWRAGQTAEAKAVGRAANDRSRSLYYHFRQLNDAITQAQLKIGDLEGAVQTARAACELGELDMSPDTVRELIRAHAAATSPKTALAEWLKFRHSPLLKAYALLGAAEAATAPRIPKPSDRP
jgi:tetratricopeptide (TPR) repeat protein